jgi:hypothetical protein
MIDQLNFLEITKSMQHCQRNFDLEKIIPDNVVDWLYDIGYSTPTKQNLNSFQIVAFTQRDVIFEIAKTATSIYDEVESTTSELKSKILTNARMQNPQVDANLLFMFFRRPESYFSNKRIIREGKLGDIDKWSMATNFEAGISAGAIALAAHSIGFKTGFCKCFHQVLLDKILTSFGLSTDNFSAALGVGYPIVSLPHYIHTDKLNKSASYRKESFTRMIY